METQELINLAQYKLNKCAETSIKNRQVFNLRVLVGHANLLDALLYHEDQLNNEMNDNNNDDNYICGNTDDSCNYVYGNKNHNNSTTSFIGTNGCMVSSKMEHESDHNKSAEPRTDMANSWHTTGQEGVENVIESDSDTESEIDSDTDSGFDSDNDISEMYNSGEDDDSEEDEDDEDVHFYAYHDMGTGMDKSYVCLSRQNSVDTIVATH